MIKEHGVLSRLTTDGILLGTPYYMSPEQAKGLKALDHRVDIYALGAVLFECLTGTVLFAGETYLEVIAKHLQEPVPPLVARKKDIVVPEEIESLVMRMLQKDPAKRPSSMQEVEEILLLFSAPTTSLYPSCSGKFDEMGATVADPRAMSLSGGKIHTTPVDWEGERKYRKFLGKRFVAKVTIFFFIFVFSAVAAIFLFDSGFDSGVSDKKVTTLESPIVTAPGKGAISGSAIKTVTVKITASPPQATITFDGKRQKSNPATVTVSPSSELAEIEVEASGYIPKKMQVPLDKDASVVVALEREKKNPRTTIKGTTLSPKESGSKKGKRELKVTEESPYLKKRTEDQ